MNILKITSNSETLAENKVLILYILDQVNKPITNDNLYKLVLSSIEMNYFYFQQFLLDLISAGFIINYPKEDQTVYELTSTGKTTLDLTLDLLPGIIKLKADTNLKPVLENIENEHSIIAEFTPRSEDNYIVVCKIMENNETIFEIKTFAGSRDEAKKIVDNWKNNAELIYPNLLDTLTKTYNNDKKGK
jgi:predicted transcriptional regulator